MNWRFDYNKNADFVRVIDEGTFNFEDHIKKMAGLVSQDFWKPGINILFDLVRVDFGEMDYNQLKKVVDTFTASDRLAGCNKIALLMKSVADFGIGRQFEMLTDEEICAD